MQVNKCSKISHLLQEISGNIEPLGNFNTIGVQLRFNNNPRLIDIVDFNHQDISNPLCFSFVYNTDFIIRPCIYLNDKILTPHSLHYATGWCLYFNGDGEIVARYEPSERTVGQTIRRRLKRPLTADQLRIIAIQMMVLQNTHTDDRKVINENIDKMLELFSTNNTHSL